MFRKKKIILRRNSSNEKLISNAAGVKTSQNTVVVVRPPMEVSSSTFGLAFPVSPCFFSKEMFSEVNGRMRWFETNTIVCFA
jgi:hypothetical protein